MYKLLNQLSQIPEINSGGCGIIAYGLYKYLENNNQLLHDTKIIFIEESNHLKEFNINNIMDGNAKGVGHVMLFHDNYYWDADGMYEDPFHCYILDEFESEPEFIDIIDRVDHFMMCVLFGKNWKWEWNYLFNREIYLPKIEKILGIKF